MARHKSLIVSMEWTTVSRSHNCRSNKNHRLEKGDRRLTVKQNGDDRHYCQNCAKLFLSEDIKRLQQLLATADDTKIL